MNDQIKCPKCGSSQIHSDRRGFKAGRAIAGTLIAGPLAGAATGAIGKNKVIITCLSCGNQFKPGEGKRQINQDSSILGNYSGEVAFVKQERSNYKCSSCGKVSSFSEVNKRCPSCGAYIRESDKVGYEKPPATNNNSDSSTGAIIGVVFVVIVFIAIIVTCS